MPIFSSLAGSYLDRELGSADSTTLFTTQRRQQAIKDGEREFVSLTECLTRESTVAITGGTAEYDLNSTILNGSTSDFMRLSARGVAYAYTNAAGQTSWTAGPESFPRRDIAWLDQYQSDWRSSTGATMPDSYYLKDEGGRMLLGFYPPPSTGSSCSAKAIVPYVALPSASTASTYVLWTVGTNRRTDLTEYHQGVVHYAAAQLEKLRKNMEGEQSQLQKFVGYVTRYVQNLRPKGGTTLRFTRSYFQASKERGEPNPTWIRTG